MLEEEVRAVLDDMIPAWKEAQEQGNQAPPNGSYTFLLKEVGVPRKIPNRKEGGSATQPLIPFKLMVLDKGDYCDHVFNHDVFGMYPQSVAQMLDMATLAAGKPVTSPHDAYDILAAKQGEFSFEGEVSRFVAKTGREIASIHPVKATG